MCRHPVFTSILAVVWLVGCTGGKDYPHVTYKTHYYPAAELEIIVPEFVWNGDIEPQPVTIRIPQGSAIKPGSVVKLLGIIRPHDSGQKPGGILAKVIRPKKTPGEDVQNVAVKEMVVKKGLWLYELEIQTPLKKGEYELQLGQIWNTPGNVIFAVGKLSIQD